MRDPRDIDHEKIENAALRVLEAYNITEPVVNAVEIAKKAGYEVKEVKMPQDDIAGFYDVKSKTIYINADDAPARKLFSVAHELGHIFLNHKEYTVLYRIPRTDEKYPVSESAANSFAAHLLMPDFMIRECMQKYNLTGSDYIRLAEIFGVPMSAMRHTLERLK